MTLEPEGEDTAHCRAIEERLAEIDATLREEDRPEAEELAEEHEEREGERDALTTGWSPEDRARARVMAYRDGGGIMIVMGLVRPEDLEDRIAASTGAAGTTGTPGGVAGEDGAGLDGPEEDAPRDLVLSASLEGDLGTERAAVIGAGLAADPALAHDLLLFRVAADLMAGFGSVTYALRVTAQRALRPHGKPADVDPRAAEAPARLREGLDLAWWEDHRTVPAQFEAFRRLEPDMKARIVAAAMADAVEPADMDHRDRLLAHVARQAVPDLRAVRRPTGEAFFARLTKGAPLGLLARDLRQPEEAARLAGQRKGAVVEHLERLFAEPFATLTPKQRRAVETWCPPGMAIASAGPFDEAEDDAFGPDDEPADAPFGDPEEVGDAPVPEAAREPDPRHARAQDRAVPPPGGRGSFLARDVHCLREGSPVRRQAVDRPLSHLARDLLAG